MTTIQKCPENATFKMMFLVFLGVAYLILGAFVFSAAELENENREKKELLLIENDLKAQSNLTEDDYKLLINTILRLEPHRSGAQWTFAGAFYFAITVVTTIGYGHSVPHTQIGKLICILYAIFGIPLWLITFQSMGERLNNTAKRCLRFAGYRSGWFSDEASQRQMIIFGLSSSFFTIMIGVIAFANFENWSYLESAYYSVMTVSTIGFGDYVALQEHESLHHNAVYVAFSFVYIILGITVIGAFLNLTIVRLFMINPDCPSNSNEKSCVNLPNNYENQLSSSAKSDEESLSENDQSAFAKPTSFLVECDSKTNFMEESSKKFGNYSFKDSLLKSMSSVFDRLRYTICCCCMSRKKFIIASESHEIATKDKSSLIFKPSSPYFSRSYNNNTNNKLHSQTEELSRLNLSGFIPANNKKDEEEIICYTASPNTNSNPIDKLGFQNVVCCTETSKSTSTLDLSVKPNNIENPNIVTNNEVATQVDAVSTKPLDKMNPYFPNCVPFVRPEEMRFRHQSCSLPNQVHNETETCRSDNRLQQIKPKPTQFRRALLTKNVNLTAQDENSTAALNSDKPMPFNKKALAFTRHNSDPQRIQDFCRRFSPN